MYRGGNDHTPKRKINIIINLSSIGDSVCSIIPLLWFKKNHNDELLLHMDNTKKQLFELFFDNIHITHEQFANVNRNLPTREASLQKITNGSCSLIDYFAMTLFSKTLSLEEKVYPIFPTKNVTPVLQKFGNINWEKCVILNPTYVWTTKAIPYDTWNQIADYVISKGYIPIWVGKETILKDGIDNYQKSQVSKRVDLSKGINLINNTNIIEILSILSLAKCLIACDSGLIHFGGMTNIDIIGAYTVKNPYDLMPIRRNEKGKAKLGYKVHLVEPKVECKYCLSNMVSQYGHNFGHNCIYKDFQCVLDMKFEKFLPHLKKIL